MQHNSGVKMLYELFNHYDFSLNYADTLYIVSNETFISTDPSHV